MPVQNASEDELASLTKKIADVGIPEDLAETLRARIERLASLAVPFSEIERFIEYVQWLITLPWRKRTQDTLDIPSAQKVLDSAHYGLQEIKERVLEYLAVMKLSREKGGENSLRAPILCFVGLVGTGKTTIAASIARALGRKFVRIPFGGLGDPGMLRGEARFHPGSQPGQIVRSLVRANAKNPVVLLDEIDRVDERTRPSIMGALVEILDPEQNRGFLDAYIDYPFDLSEVLFIATANNTTNIATAVLDRLEVIQMPSYTDEEKIVIGRDFLLPRALEEAGLSRDTILIADSVWPTIVRPLGYDAGMRTLERTIEGVVRKIAKLVVEGRGVTFQLNESNIKEFLPTW